MLSAFLKKLLFARQLFMSDGKIQILGKDQIMLPSDIIVALQALDEKRYYSVVKQGVTQNLKDYTKRIGATSSGMFKITEDIFETFGMGRPEIILLDQKKKVATVRFHASPVALACGNNKVQECVLLPAALAGMFSFLFDKEVDVDITQCNKNGTVWEYVVK